MSTNTEPRVISAPFPHSISAVVAYDESGLPEIYINAELDKAQRQDALSWALDSIASETAKPSIETRV